MVADSRTCIPGRVLIEGIPVSNRWNLEKLKEGEADSYSQHQHHVEELRLGAIHIRVDVEQEHNIDDRDELRREFDRTSRPDEDKEEEL